MEETFVCQECGQTFPRRKMKELFVWHGKTRERREVCPSDLDRWMPRGRVHGIVGEVKKAAVDLLPGVGMGVRRPIK